MSEQNPNVDLSDSRAREVDHDTMWQFSAAQAGLKWFHSQGKLYLGNLSVGEAMHVTGR
jgi:hypothetical protein